MLETGGGTVENAGRAAGWLALRLALLYAVVAGAWIILSDRVLGWMDLPHDLELRISSVKGIGFVVVTAVLLFLLALGFVRHLRVSQERYAHLFENAAEGLTVFRLVRDHDGELVDLEVVDVNPVQVARTGSAREAVIGRQVSQLADLDERTRAYARTVERAARAGEPSRSELHVESDDAHELLEAYPISADRWALAAVDISERFAAQQRLAEWRDLMQYIIRHDPNAIAVYDKDLRYVFVSDRYLHDYRVDDRDVIGKHQYEILPETPQRWKDVHQRVLRGAIERADEDRFERLDGSLDYNRWECRPWFKPGGEVGGIVTYTEVISERKKAEQALRESEQRYETFINATDDMAFLKDEELRYVMVNAANAAFFGRQADEIVGRTDDDLMPPDAAAACRASDEAALDAGGVVCTHEELGGRVYETRKFPVRLEDGCVGVGGYVRDVTEHYRAEAEVSRLNADLERRVRERTAQLEATNRELESFAYAISHDLRAPLRALDGFSEILVEDYGDRLDDEGRAHLRRIRGAAGHMAGLMDGLLQLSRLNRDELVYQEVDLTAMAEEIVADLRGRDDGRLADVSVAPGLVAAADPKLTHIALENLLGNAWKFTARRAPARIEFGAERQGGRVVYYVRDNGAGFDMRYADKLFGAFQRLHTPDEFEGTGIGLATVQRIVNRHGGSVWAEAAVDEGATFWFTLAPDGDD